ncbi:TRAP transporter substrate-binding protein [Bacillus suaedaesalsae]|uniref:TRAP transporter substrate-binding protein n=1 Tax=Bacillus suaedaesalsae TaxID=2810349 RepID=A0ABS2DDU3_9BACI|nr:TRAP transporter substrate-binding protein [Bacillus suaedaesalsae]MBM6616625.1 TRAP transporter substrate-binding protein [Bacillus suaedaesalsae]
MKKKWTAILKPTNLLIIVTLIVFPIIPMTFIRALGLKFAEPDTLAYFGSILGGLLTIVGVSLTIRHSDNSYKKAYAKDLENEFIQSFPQKIEAINSVKIESEKFLAEFKSMITKVTEHPELVGIKYETLKELKNTYSNKLLPVAAKLDGHVYVEVIHYLEEIDHYNSFILDKDRYIQSHSLEMYKEEFKVKYAHACLKISRSIEFFSDYQKSIGDYFTEITKDKNLWKANPMLNQQQRKRKLVEKLFQRVGQATSEKLKITVAHNQTSLENPYHIGMQKFKEEIERISNDTLQVEIHAGTLGTSEIELLTKLQKGTIDVVVVSPDVVSRIGIEELDLLTIPYLFDNYDHWERAVDGKVGQYMSSLIKRKSNNSLHVLGYMSAGVRHYYGKKPIAGLEDLKGMTVRTQTTGVAAEYLTKIGAITTSLVWGEIYQGLQQKTIDFAENAYPYFVQQKHHKTDNGKYITETGHDYTTRFLLMNGKTYNALSRHQKKLIMEAARSAVEEERRAVYEQEAVYKEIAVQEGAEIFHTDPHLFKHIVEPIQQTLAKEIETETLLKTIKALKQVG